MRDALYLAACLRPCRGSDLRDAPALRQGRARPDFPRAAQGARPKARWGLAAPPLARYEPECRQDRSPSPCKAAPTSTSWSRPRGKAARSLVKDFREVENLQVGRKGPGDFVTKADRAAEEIIRDELTEARPNYGWLGEETGAADGKDPTRRWIVDPLDGTTNYLHGMPHWAVSIALEHKGEVVAGVVFDAAKDEMFLAEKGAGAWLNGNQRLRVSGRTALIETVHATGVPWAGSKYLPAALKDIGRLMPVCAGLRRWGVASLDLAYVAAGRFDGFWERGLHPWDIAAGWSSCARPAVWWSRSGAARTCWGMGTSSRDRRPASTTSPGSSVRATDGSPTTARRKTADAARRAKMLWWRARGLRSITPWQPRVGGPT